mgnify:CR=1 FL=1
MTISYIPQIAFKCFVIVRFSRHFFSFFLLLCINTIHFNQKSAFWISKIKYPRPTKRYQTKLYISHLVKFGSSKFYIFVSDGLLLTAKSNQRLPVRILSKESLRLILMFSRRSYSLLSVPIFAELACQQRKTDARQFPRKPSAISPSDSNSRSYDRFSRVQLWIV